MQWLTTVYAHFCMQDGQMSTLKAEVGMKEEQSKNIAGNMMEF